MPRYRVDLRSDTVTEPSARMREAMASAEVGDAWYGDDPTVNRLQDLAAELTGAEAALYVATGTMANQIGLRLHANGAGHLIVSERYAHVASTEVMTAAAIAGLSFRTAASPAGMTADLARELLWTDDYYDVEVVDLLTVENTLGAYGGTIVPTPEMKAIRDVADRAGLPIHLDGARLWNAVAATGEPVTAWTGHADTFMFCLSKGLGAPVGSMLCGPAELLREARRIWILYGGAWRQAGIMAAAGIVALEDGRDRLVEDHERARRLAAAIEEMSPGAVDHAQVATNMVLVDTEAVGQTAATILERLAGLGVGGVPMDATVIRMVTHVGVDDDGIAFAIDAWRSVVSTGAKES